MTRNFKAIGLALVAVLAISAVAASAAQANNVTAKKYPATLAGSDLNTEHGKLARLTVGEVGARFVECTTANLSATINAATTAVTVTPSYANCFSNGLTAVPATVTMNSCDYVLEATSKTTGQARVKCSTAGDAIEVHVYENETKHKENVSMCTYRIAEQGPITGAAISKTNEGTETEDIDLSLAALAAFKVTNTVGAAGLCGVAAGKEGKGTLRGSYTVTGSSAGAHTAVMIE